MRAWQVALGRGRAGRTGWTCFSMLPAAGFLEASGRRGGGGGVVAGSGTPSLSEAPPTPCGPTLAPRTRPRILAGCSPDIPREEGGQSPSTDEGSRTAAPTSGLGFPNMGTFGPGKRPSLLLPSWAQASRTQTGGVAEGTEGPQPGRAVTGALGGGGRIQGAGSRGHVAAHVASEPRPPPQLRVGPAGAGGSHQPTRAWSPVLPSPLGEACF